MASATLAGSLATNIETPRGSPGINTIGDIGGKMTGRTIFLSKLIGIYCILLALPMAMHKQATLLMVTALVNDASAMYLFGLITVAAGLAIILNHNRWSGGALPIVVTLVGWLTLLKGMLSLILPPPEAAGIGIWGSAYHQYYYLDVALAFILGVFLTYGGFRSNSQ